MEDSAIGGNPTPFVNSFTNPTIGSLRYNTAQYGSPIPLVWGTQRVSVNVLQLWNFKSSGSGSGKGGITSGGKGKSGGKQYTVDAIFGVCVGPVSFPPGNAVYSNAGVGTIGGTPLNYYQGYDGQAPDPTAASTFPYSPVIGYSGVANFSGTPLQLGNAPALPNISVELQGFRTNQDTGTQYLDANPRWILWDILYDPRIGIGFPGQQGDFSDWGTFCQANLFAMSLIMDRQQPVSSWIEELMQLTISAIFWSSGRLRVVPYFTGDQDANGAAWFPNISPVYNLTDDDFLPWSTGRRTEGDRDPVIVTRNDVSDIINWMTIEILDRANWYNASVQPPVFDQASIELHGIRTGSSVQAHEVCSQTEGYSIANLMLRRKLYLRNTYQFRLGWRHILLEPMDVVTINDTVSGLTGINVRVTEIQEDDLGALTITAEDLV